MRVIVTGGAGFIGSHLVDRLLADGHCVVAVDDLSRGSAANLEQAQKVAPADFSFLCADVNAPQFADLVLGTHPDAVCHLAAQIDVRVSVAEPLLDARINVLGTISVLEASRRAGVPRVIFTSSGGSIYGKPSELPVCETAKVDPHSPYAAGKAAGELYLNAYQAMYGLSYTTLALANVYGPRQDPFGEAGVVAIFGRSLLQSQATVIYGDGSAVRDYVYVEDVVDAYARALTRPATGSRINIGTGVPTSVRSLHRVLAMAAGAADFPGHVAPRVGELQEIFLDSGLAAELLDWRPKTDLAGGVRETLRWISQQLSNPDDAASAGHPV